MFGCNPRPLTGGGQALKQRQAVTETVDDFLEKAQERGKFPILCTGSDVATLSLLFSPAVCEVALSRSTNAEEVFGFV